MATSTETRELAVAPARERLLALIGERRPDDAVALRAFATEYLRRLSADATQSTPPEALFAEVAGAFDFAAARGDRPIAVRAFNPTVAEHGYEPVDHGPFDYDALDDYPVFCLRAAEAVAAEPGSLGVVIGGSGNGEQMAANKVTGIRCALVWSEETAVLARQHNDA